MEDKSEKKLIWVVFYGVSALGKTYFLKFFESICKDENVFCQIVSSDDSSKIAIDKAMAKNKAMTREEAFESTKKESIKIFEDAIDKAVKHLKNGNNVIVLDKVMNGGRFLQNINKTFKPCCATKLVALIPTHGEFHYTNHGVVPFSQGLIINVLYRILNREDHQTVSGTDSKKAFLAISFIKLYHGLSSLTEKKDEGHIDEFVEISFAPEFTEERENCIS